jgi:hypothetical protein
MYVLKVLSKRIRKKLFFVGILKVTEEKSRILPYRKKYQYCFLLVGSYRHLAL